jgi:hypothetical protein
VIAAPRVAAAVANALTAPAGVFEWLCAWEAELAARAEQAAEACDAAEREGVPVIPLLSAAREDAWSALDDPHAGALPRLLRRPLWQLEDGQPARAVFDRFARRLVERVDAAIAVQAHAARAYEALAALRARHEARYPAFLARALSRTQTSEADIAATRRAAEAEAIIARLTRVAAEFAGYDALLAAAPDWATTTLLSNEPLTAAEVAVATSLACRERERLLSARIQASGVQTALARHVSTLTAVTDDTSDVPLSTDAPLLGELLASVCRLQAHVRRRGADAPLWAAALGGDLGRGLPRLDMAPAVTEGPPVAPNTLYAVPLNEGLVYLSPHLPSAVRVWTAGVQAGATVQGQVVAGRVAGEDLALVERDLAPLFDGVDAAGSYWYRTAERVRLNVVGRRGDAWYARVAERGSVKRLDTPAWADEGGAVGAFCLPRPVSAAASGAHPARREPVAVASAGVPPLPTFFGFGTEEVHTPLAGDGRAWMRVGAPTRAGVGAVMAREWSLFAALRDTARGVAPALEPLALGRAAGAARSSPLYRVPLAMMSWLPAGGTTRRDVSLDERLAALAAIARVVRAVHDAGWALGVVDPAAFAWSLRWRADGSRLEPAAVLAYAPVATRLGEPFTIDAVPRVGGWIGPRYRRLNTPSLTRHVTGGQPATTVADTTALLFCALEVLADSDIAPSGVDHADIRDVVEGGASQFAEPTLAVALAGVLFTGDARAAGRLFELLATKSAPSARDLLDVS